jgi:hypothetical protein
MAASNGEALCTFWICERFRPSSTCRLSNAAAWLATTATLAHACKHLFDTKSQASFRTTPEDYFAAMQGAITPGRLSLTSQTTATRTLRGTCQL